MMEDCYYFVTATCNKGASCPFRHCEAAKQTSSICPAWLAGGPGCTDTDCTLRHSTFAIKRRSEIECYWQGHGGCKKTDCPFKHTAMAEGAPVPTGASSAPDTSSPSTAPGPSVAAATSAPASATPGLSRVATGTPAPPVAATIASRASLGEQGRHRPLDFEIKSFDEIMKEKRQRLQSPLPVAIGTPSPEAGTITSEAPPLPTATEQGSPQLAKPAPPRSISPSVLVAAPSAPAGAITESPDSRTNRSPAAATTPSAAATRSRAEPPSKPAQSVLDDEAIDEQFAEIERLINS